MPTQTPMTVEEVFAGYDFRTNGDREGTTFYFNGHLTAEQVATTYSRACPNPGAPARTPSTPRPPATPGTSSPLTRRTVT